MLVQSLLGRLSLAKNILPLWMTLDLGFGKWAEGNDRDPFAPGILDRLARKAFTDLPATQSGRNVGMVDDDQFFASATVGHLRFDAIDDDAVSPLRWPILPSNRLAGRWGSLLRTLSVRQSNLAAQSMRAL